MTILPFSFNSLPASFLQFHDSSSESSLSNPLNESKRPAAGSVHLRDCLHSAILAHSGKNGSTDPVRFEGEEIESQNFAFVDLTKPVCDFLQMIIADRRQRSDRPFSILVVSLSPSVYQMAIQHVVVMTASNVSSGMGSRRSL